MVIHVNHSNSFSWNSIAIFLTQEGYGLVLVLIQISDGDGWGSSCTENDSSKQGIFEEIYLDLLSLGISVLYKQLS